ncbi:MAG: hypothetical protein JRD64_07365 [Deltaproteobacteria bacterium]|jgi:hypothetical protein|nr:hypothetical protein [Deltaproteobacteria bacterium]MBW2522510.1 hypothetical protein [Deltaproteobacteria bacterium]
MEQTDSERLRKAILEVIHNQVRDNDPPETGLTVKRLRQQGFSEEETLKLVGFVVASEVFGVLKENRPYEEERYIAALKRLPKLPWDEEA